MSDKTTETIDEREKAARLVRAELCSVCLERVTSTLAGLMRPEAGP